ncbi:MAG: hypothetical protein AAGB12_02765 [Pseudomonadota bacterium]
MIKKISVLILLMVSHTVSADIDLSSEVDCRVKYLTTETIEGFYSRELFEGDKVSKTTAVLGEWYMGDPNEPIALEWFTKDPQIFFADPETGEPRDARFFVYGQVEQVVNAPVLAYHYYQGVTTDSMVLMMFTTADGVDLVYYNNPEATGNIKIMELACQYNRNAIIESVLDKVVVPQQPDIDFGF